MKEKIQHVKNPLTIIAIFSGISEISASAVLPFISESLQKTFIWFVIIFPFVLILLFFITLWTKHHVLYAPSDFKSDESFLKVVPSTGQEIKEKIIEETNEQKTLDSDDLIQSENSVSDVDYNNPGFDVSAHENFALAEQLCLNKLRDTFGPKFKNQSTIHSGNIKIRVDGLLQDKDHWYLHEIKYFSAVNIQMSGIGKNINNFKRFRQASSLNKKITYHIHIVTPVDDEGKKKIIDAFVNNFGKDEDIELNIVDYIKLRKEYNFD